MEDYEWPEAVRKNARRDVLSSANDGEHEAVRAAIGFHDAGHPHCDFNDFWECNVKQYTRGYIWCLRAIVWGIRQYDALKEGIEVQS